MTAEILVAVAAGAAILSGLAWLRGEFNARRAEAALREARAESERAELARHEVARALGALVDVTRENRAGGAPPAEE